MRKLYVVRHSKSSWKDLSIDDFDRPLNKRGKNDSKFIGKLLNRMGVKSDLIISSPAKRALKTAVNISKELDYEVDNLNFEINLYEASLENLLKVINSIDDKNKIVIIIGHNPSLNMLVNFLQSQKDIPNIVTSGVVELSFDTKWKKIKQNSAKLISYEYPKKYS